MTAVVTLIGALVAAASTIAAALITTRQRGPAGTVASTALLSNPPQPVYTPAQPPRTSRSVWCGLAGFILWILPIVAYFVVIPGLYVGIRDLRGPRTGCGTGIALCALSLLASVVNSAWGAYMGAHGQLWFQHGNPG